MQQFAVMNIEKGEQIAIAVVSGHIPGTGRYKFLSKKKKNGEFEWAHFTERDNGNKENVYRGEVKTEDELKLVLGIMNKTLKKIFGDKAEMKEGIPEFRSLLGTKFDDSIN
jgi:hypothetical protein